MMRHTIYTHLLMRSVCLAALWILGGGCFSIKKAENILPIRQISTQILVIGGGASGTAAALEAARSGVQTHLIESSTWLGGMLTSAGVSATDGNHELPSGIWGEFRQRIYQHYGGAQKVATGWVSNTHFEPHVGAAILDTMCRQSAPNLTVHYQTIFQSITKNTTGWTVQTRDTATQQVTQWSANIVIDATELGDIARAVGIDYAIGTDDPNATTEKGFAVKKTDIVQDFTLTAILKDYGNADPARHRIARPPNYDPNEFRCACRSAFCTDTTVKAHDCTKMLSYARLPNGKILLNWPGAYGNDYYANLIDAPPQYRAEQVAAARQKTLRYAYFIQNDLGFTNLGLADDEFPTRDGLAALPYHRESRRIKGLARLHVGQILNPFQYNTYKTGIAVGDYPIDHHHAQRADAPKIYFPPIPSYNIPLGALIPRQPIDNFIVAEKSISVTNLVNGTTRLQPVVMGIGQAAGALAAVAVRSGRSPRAVSIRAVQAVLVAHNAYLMPFADVKPTHAQFAAIQKIGAMGILHGKGEPNAWANRTWFYPDSVVVRGAIFHDSPKIDALLKTRSLTRAQFAAWFLAEVLPFEQNEVDWDGN